MRSRPRVAALLAGALGLQVLAAVPATAEQRAGGDAGAYVDGGGNPTATASDAGVKAASSEGGDDRCDWSVVIEDDIAYALYEINGRRMFSETGRWLQRICDGESQSVSGSYLVAEGGQVDPGLLAADALESVTITAPVLNTSPEADRRLYVRVPTWLWIDQAWWQSYTATATAGRVTSTVTARPTAATWSTGDGGRQVCDGPGVAWSEGMPEDGTYCRHTYVRSSAGEPGGTYTLTVTVVFEVTWTSNVGLGGALAGPSRSASRFVEVGEIQAVESQ